ncbi:hypothetical protein ANCDUO_08927 [Ancylostoma duodenale]|uniref:Uncharacterized protein n=1 Tax=Ancylostoma duodenale TaxID=51022 RepID=A0A0C2GNZ5_9BILA|nr:hypothetical protein ANCDUO_08927 [Ancylostoma duodenale]
MDDRLSSLNLPSICTLEDLEDSMEELVKLNEEEGFLFTLTLPSQTRHPEAGSTATIETCASDVYVPTAAPLRSA